MFEILFPALLTGLLLSLITAPLGAFVVWRKMAYFGDTLSHSALLGVALGIWLQINPYLAIVILTILLAVLMVYLESKTDRKSTRLNSSHPLSSRMPSSA